MSEISIFTPLAPPTSELAFDEVTLRLHEIVPGDSTRDFVPYYHFRILIADGVDVGHINFRVGNTEHIQLYAGHIGFQIEEALRGHGYALQACRAIAPLVRTVYKSVLITCDPENVASRRTIERLGAEFVDQISAASPEGQPRFKRRYNWTLPRSQA